MIAGIGLITLSAACGALSHACAKKALNTGMHTHAFLVWRSFTGLITAALIFTVLCIRNGIPTISLHTLGIAMLVGLWHPVLSNTLYFTGLKGGDLSVMSPLINTYPLFATVIATLLLGEKQTAGTMAALAMIIVGAVCIPLTETLPLRSRPGKPFPLASSLLGLGGAASMALYVVCGKQALKSTDPKFIVLVLNAVAFSTFLGTALAKSPARPRTTQSPARKPYALAYTFASGILAFAVCSFLSLYALTFIPASFVASLSSTGAIFGMLFGTLLLDERPSKRRWLGALLIVAGCILCSLTRT